MSNKILYLAESGTGKTSSLRALEPSTTAIINCDKKELPIRGWLSLYKTIRGADGKVDWFKSNYVETDVPSNVIKALEAWEKVPHITTIVIDTITHMITGDYITNAIGKDYKQYQMLAKNFIAVVELIRNSKKDIAVLGHLKRDINDMGDIVIDMRTHGKLIADLVPASYFTTVIIGEVKRHDGKTEYLVRTQSQGNDPAKSPAYFEDDDVKTALEYYEPNNLALLFNKLDKFAIGPISM